MTDHEVERALGYSPCVCGVIDGTWHARCYQVKRNADQVAAAQKKAMANARAHLRARVAAPTSPTPTPEADHG